MKTYNISLVALLKRLWLKIKYQRRRQLALLVVLMIISAFAEIISIGAVLPFLAVLTAPDRVYGNSAIQPFIQVLGISSSDQLIFPLTMFFGVTAIGAGLLRILLLKLSTRLSFSIGAELGMDVYRRTLYQPYAVHVSRNSSEVIDAIVNKANAVIFGIMAPSLTLISSSILMIGILIALFTINPLIAFSAFGGFATIYFVIIQLSRKKLKIYSQSIARDSIFVIKSLQEGLGGIRDVLLDGSQSVYCDIYQKADLSLRRAQGNIQFIGQSPRPAMEALGMLLIAILAYLLTRQQNGVSDAIPVLGALALGAQRLLPVLQQAYNSWIGMLSVQSSLQDTIELLDQPLPENIDQPNPLPILFQKQININQLSFRYSTHTPLVLNNINLVITKGSRLGFIGVTGSGKSTLLDIVMGLLSPTEGSLGVDGQLITLANNRSWQAHIAHVPQSIFLSDATIEENIAFGVPKEKIDHGQVRHAAQQAQIAEMIETWSEGYQTFVGERGVRLSGGQRQRIGIARALYKQADVIIFDEATSALDNETEEAVMQAIESLSKDLTLLIIAHRLSTLKNCTQIVELGSGGIKRVGTYQDIVNQSVIAIKKNKES